MNAIVRMGNLWILLFVWALIFIGNCYLGRKFFILKFICMYLNDSNSYFYLFNTLSYDMLTLLHLINKMNTLTFVSKILHLTQSCIWLTPAFDLLRCLRPRYYIKVCIMYSMFLFLLSPIVPEKYKGQAVYIIVAFLVI